MYELNITNEDINIDIEDTDKYIKYIEKLTNIQWRIIPNYEDYIISEYGNVINLKHKRILNPILNKNKFYQVGLYKNSINKSFLISKLIYNTFVDKNIKLKDKIFFKDGNKNNYHYSNLSLKFILPKNLVDLKSILYNNTITNISKSIEYEDLKKIVNKHKSDNITDFVKNIQKDTKLEWRIIPNYTNYIISEYGDIINLKFKDILKPYLSRGYYIISLCKNNICKTSSIHRLVYNTFIKPIGIKEFHIHHKDRNKLNNHYSNLEKMINSDHRKHHYNQESEKYLEQYKKYYDLKYKKNLSVKEIAKRYNVSISSIDRGIQQYKIYLFNNKDINKYNSSNIKEKQDFYSNIILKEDKRRYLEKAEEIYNRKNKEHLTYEQLAKIYNIPESSIEYYIQDIKIYIYILNRNFNEYCKLSQKQKRQLRKDITEIERKKYLKEYLKKAEEIYNRKNKEHLTYEQLAKIYNIPESSIEYYIQDIKIYIYILNRDFNKFYNLTKKEKLKLRKKITDIERKEYLKKYLEKAEEIYNRKNKENSIDEQLVKIYNIPKYIIRLMIKDIKIYIYILDRDFDKFYKLSKKEKIQLRKNITEIERKEYVKKYLEKAEEIYNRKIKENLTYKQLAKIYNIPESSIEYYIQEIKCYIFLLDKDFNKFYNLSGKEKLKLRKKITIIDKRNNNILDIGKQIKDLKLSGLSNKDITNKLNLSKNKILDIYKKYKKLINDRKIKDELKSIKKYN